MKKKANVIGTIRLGLLLALVLAMLIPSLVVRAEAPDWIQGEISGTRDETASPYSLYGDCSDQLVRVGRLYDTYQERNACVYLAKSFRYALIDGTLHISSGIDTDMYPLVDVGFASRSRILPSPESDDFIYGTLISRDFLNKISLVTDAPAKHYVQNQDFSYNFAQDEQGSVSYAPQGSAISRNGRWLIVNFQNVGLVRYHLTDMSVTRIASYSSGLSFLSISNDGRYIAESASATNYQPVIFDMQDCGQSASTLQSGWNNANFSNSCQSRSLSEDVNNILQTSGSNTYERPAFSDDDGQLVIYSFPHGGSGAIKVTLNAPKYATEPRLDYLALGDSYSSGEGDITRTEKGESNYRYDTDNKGDIDKGIPREMCHLSERSYPYRLAQGMELGEFVTDGTQKWGSVACSGATIKDIRDKNVNNSDYMGQINDNIPRLQGFSNYDQLKRDALIHMTPGRNQQIEYIKKYNPNTVTLTIGGNDVQFASIVRACVSPTFWDGGEWTTNCSYARDDQKKSYIAQSILQQYDKLVSLYEDIRKAGNESMKLYVLGYPAFINEKVAPTNSVVDNIRACGMNVRLNYDERRMVAESTRFLNQVIRAAADEAGAIYIDTETALDGHRLCDDSDLKAVNGITGLWDNNESFHPNSYGHALLANRIWDATDGKTLSEYICHDSVYVTCPGGDKTTIIVPDYFKKALETGIKAVNDNTISASVAKLGEMLFISSPFGFTLFAGNSTVQILLYSDPTNLGTASASENGSISKEVVLPSNITPGYHTLELRGMDVNGEPITIWKIIEIRSTDENDYDGDGVLNDLDDCQYIQAAGYDLDKDGIDDACDLDASGDYPIDVPVQDHNSSQLSADNPLENSFVAVDDMSTQHRLLANKETSWVDPIHGNNVSDSAPNNKEASKMSASDNDVGRWILIIAAVTVAIISGILLVRRRKT